MQTAEKGGVADEAPSAKACLVCDSHTKIAPKVSRGGEACGDFCRAPTQTQAGTRPPPAQSQSTRRGSVWTQLPQPGPDSWFSAPSSRHREADLERGHVVSRKSAG